MLRGGKHIGEWQFVSLHVAFNSASLELRAAVAWLPAMYACSNHGARSLQRSPRTPPAQLQQAANENDALALQHSSRAARTQKRVCPAAWQSADQGTRLCLRMNDMRVKRLIGEHCSTRPRQRDALHLPRSADMLDSDARAVRCKER